MSEEQLLTLCACTLLGRAEWLQLDDGRINEAVRDALRVRARVKEAVAVLTKGH